MLSLSLARFLSLTESEHATEKKGKQMTMEAAREAGGFFIFIFIFGI
jgi:hypothetical protein